MSAEIGDQRLPERFWSKVQLNDITGCWEWTGATDRHGYAHWRGASAIAHRAAYLAIVGEIPEGLELDHTCRTRNCVNPDHLDPVTASVNSARSLNGYAARGYICKGGHDVSLPGSTRRDTRKPTARSCVLCERERGYALRALLREARSLLGITRDEYVSRYGQSSGVAKSIISAHRANIPTLTPKGA